LQILCVLGPSHAPSYRYLMDVVFSKDYGSRIELVYSFMMVRIEGRNLAPVAAAILDGTCAFIQDFDAREFATPADQDAPMIEKITFIVGKEDK